MARSTMKSGLMLVCAGSLLTASAVMAGPEEDAKAVVQRAMDVYGDVSAYEDNVLTKFTMKTEGAPMPDQEESDELTFQFSRPGKFAVTGSEQIEVYSDGAKVTTYVPDFGQYIENDYDEAMGMREFVSGDFANMLILSHPVAAILVDGIDSADKMPLVKTFTGVEASEHEGKAGKLVSVEIDLSNVMPLGEPVPAHYWFDDATGLLGHAKIDLQASMQAMIEAQAPFPVTVTEAQFTMQYAQPKWNHDIAPATFAFAPKANDKKVTDFAPPGMGGDGPSQDELVGKPAPSFSGTAVDGQPLSLEALRGKVVVLDFWATWCPPCKRALPHIQAISADYADKGVVVIGVNRDRPGQEQLVRDYSTDNDITFRHILEGSGAIANNYGVTGIPCTVIIDGEGVIQAIHTGFAPGGEKKYRAELDKLLAGENLF